MSTPATATSPGRRRRHGGSEGDLGDRAPEARERALGGAHVRLARHAQGQARAGAAARRTITPVMFVLMFTYIFGGAIAGSTGAYLDYILPGILVMSVLFTTVYSGVALNTDLTKGVVDRFRTLPIWRPAPLVGALLGDSVRYLVAGIVIVAVGMILGYRPDGGRRRGARALLVVVFAFALSWVFQTIGLLMRSPNAVMNAGFMGIFPLTFLSNVFVEPDTLPAALEAFVNVNPISILADASRGLMAGDVDMGDIGIVFGTAVVLTAIFMPLTTHLYRTRSA